MSKMKVIKIDPLELSPHLTWSISGLLQISLKDFSMYIDEKENTMYVNKNLKIPKKDMDRIIEIATSSDIWLTDEQFDFLDYVYEKYGYSACKTIHRSHDSRKEAKLKQQAEQMAETITPIIEKERQRISPNEFLIYYIRKAGDKCGGKTVYNMVGKDSIYNFMLGYLAGAGKIAADGVFSIEEDFDEESEG